MGLNLTKPQEAFLADYLDDICHGDNEGLRTAERDAFVAKVTGMDFDGQATAQLVRVASNLRMKGVLKGLDVHYDRTGSPCIYLEFSEVGAGSVFDVMKKQTKKWNRVQSSGDLLRVRPSI
mgnify:CR=1 FL=1